MINCVNTYYLKSDNIYIYTYLIMTDFYLIYSFSTIKYIIKSIYICMHKKFIIVNIDKLKN